MKYFIKFDMEDEWDRSSFEDVHKAVDYKICLEDLNNKFRAWEKYEEKESVTVEELRKVFYEILEDHGVEI